MLYLVFKKHRSLNSLDIKKVIKERRREGVFSRAFSINLVIDSLHYGKTIRREGKHLHQHLEDICSKSRKSREIRQKYVSLSLKKVITESNLSLRISSSIHLVPDSFSNEKGRRQEKNAKSHQDKEMMEQLIRDNRPTHGKMLKKCSKQKFARG